MRRVLLAAPLAVVFFASPMPAAAQSWVVVPASDGADIMSQLFWFTLVLATIVFVLIEGLLIYSSLRFRRRAPLPFHEPPQIHGNTRLEVMWATVPVGRAVGVLAKAAPPTDASAATAIPAMAIRFTLIFIRVTSSVRLPTSVRGGR